MSIKRMNVENHHSVKLTKPGDSLDGTVNRVRKHLSKRCNTKANVLLLTGTNDLSRPQKLLDKLTDSVNEWQQFKNMKVLFLSKVSPRSDHAVIFRKVCGYNDLMFQHFADNESVIVIDTVPFERGLFTRVASICLILV